MNRQGSGRCANRQGTSCRQALQKPCRSLLFLRVSGLRGFGVFGFGYGGFRVSGFRGFGVLGFGFGGFGFGFRVCGGLGV